MLRVFIYFNIFFVCFFFLFPSLFQSHAEDVLHNIQLQSVHHHEANRKQVISLGSNFTGNVLIEMYLMGLTVTDCVLIRVHHWGHCFLSRTLAQCEVLIKDLWDVKILEEEQKSPLFKKKQKHKFTPSLRWMNWVIYIFYTVLIFPLLLPLLWRSALQLELVRKSPP